MFKNSFLAATALTLVLLFGVGSPVLAAVHTVKNGESLYKISQQYDTSVGQIKKENNLKSDTIKPGQKLNINGNQYTVKKGDSLFSISKKLGVSLAQLKSVNGLKSDRIHAGQKLRIPQVATSSVTPARGGGISYTQDDLQWLAKAIHGEARGESYRGQVAVGAVIVNRVKSKDFPNTIKGVIFQPLAFTAVADKQIYLTPNASALRAAREALSGVDPTNGALYYWNPVTATSKWVWSRPIMMKIGNHVFAK